MQIDVSQTTGIACEGCGHKLFEPAFYLRRVSRLITGGPRDEVIELMTYTCQECGLAVNPDPDDVRPAPPEPPAERIIQEGRPPEPPAER